MRTLNKEGVEIKYREPNVISAIRRDKPAAQKPVPEIRGNTREL